MISSIKHVAALAALSLAVVAAIPTPSVASGPATPRKHHQGHGKHSHRKKHRRRTVRSHGGVVSVHLGAVAIEAPKGAIRKGQTLTLEAGAPKKFPDVGQASLVGGPFTISTSQGEPAKPVKIKFHQTKPSDSDPLVLHGLKEFGDWVPEDTTVSGSTVSAKLISFSPIDVVDGITWAAGDLTGNRTDLPSGCGSSPSWIDWLTPPYTRNDSLPACVGAESDEQTLYIHVANNRGYAQYLTISNATLDVKRSHWSDSLEGLIANQFAALAPGNSPSRFLLAPGSHAVLALDRPAESFGETAVSIQAAPQGSSAMAEMGWALVKKVKTELGDRVNIVNCAVAKIHESLSTNPSANDAVKELKVCASAASAGLSGNAKSVLAKIANAVLVVDFFYKLVDLEAAEAYPVGIKFSIHGKNPTNPNIHVGNLSFGSLPAGQQTIEHLTATGGSAPYSFHMSHAASNTANVPSWIQLASDGTLTIDPPASTNRNVGFYVYATDAVGQSSPFERDEVSFTIESKDSPGGGALSWSAIQLPIPPGGDAGSGYVWNSSACSGAGACVVVGSYRENGAYRSMVDVLSGGSWSAIPLPIPPGGDAGSGTFGHLVYGGDLEYRPACSAGNICVIAGSYEEGGVERGMIDTLSGGVWSSVPTPTPPGGEAGYSSAGYSPASGPACSAEGTCVMSGYYWKEGEGHSMVLILSGGSWSAENVPIPPGGEAGSGESFEEACSDDGTCVLFASYREGGVRRVTLNTLRDGSWSVVKYPGPSGDDPEFVAGLGEPTCSDEGTCVATGSFQEGGMEQGVIGTLSGGTWSAARSPIPPGGDPGSGHYLVHYWWGSDFLGSSACSDDGICVVPGGYTEAGVERQMIDTLSGGSWSATPVPVPPGGEAGSGYYEFQAPACSNEGTCVIPGGFSEGGMIDTLSGGSWSAIRTPVPPEAGAAIGHVSTPACSNDGTCVVPGSYANERGMIDTLSGGSWSAIQAPVPPGGETASGRELNSPVCSDEGTCVMFGSYRPIGGYETQMIVVSERQQ